MPKPQYISADIYTNSEIAICQSYKSLANEFSSGYYFQTAEDQQKLTKFDK